MQPAGCVRAYLHESHHYYYYTGLLLSKSPNPKYNNLIQCSLACAVCAADMKHLKKIFWVKLQLTEFVTISVGE